MTDYTPPDIGSLNKVIQVLWFPCAPTPQLWIECLFPAALTAFWTLISPSWKEVVEHTTHGSWIHNIREFAQDVEAEDSVLEAGGVLFMFEVAAWIDIAAFWLFVAGLLFDFAAEWTSQVWKLAGCIPDPVIKSGWSSSSLGLISNDGTWQDGPAWGACHGDLGDHFSAGWDIPPNSYLTIAVAIQWTDVDLTVIPMDLRLIDEGTGEVLKMNAWDPERHSAKESNMIMRKNIYSGGGHRHIKFETRFAGSSSLAFVFSGKGYCSATLYTVA